LSRVSGKPIFYKKNLAVRKWRKILISDKKISPTDLILNERINFLSI
jgi:hypothetical protein